MDSGAKYTLLPLKNWKAIGLKPERRLTFVLADGTKVKRDIAEGYIKLPQGNVAKLRALIDLGSQVSLITEAACQQLGLKKKN